MGLRALLALSAILGVALAGCSGGDDDSGDDSGANTSGSEASSNNASSSGTPDACSLLTPDQIKAQFGVTVDAGTPSSTGGATSPACSWKPIDFSAQFGGVNLTVQKDAKGEFFEFTRAGAKERVDVPGLGKAAFFETPANPYTLWINGGEYLYTLYVVAAGGGPAENQQKVISLGQIVLTK